MQIRPTNLPESMKPSVIWQQVEPADVLDSIGTLGSLRQEGRIVTFRGEPVDTLLGWALSEVEQAERAQTSELQRKHASQAVAHAKKAIDGLFDAYIERDFLDVQLQARPTFSAKLQLLRERLGESLPWRLIPAVVARPRNASEHERVAPSVEGAGVAVEAARVVVEAMTTLNHPLRGPGLAGAFAGSAVSGPRGHHIYVESFPPQFALVWRDSKLVARAGVGIASTKDAAEVIHAPLSAFTRQQHLALLCVWDRFDTSSWIDEISHREKLKLAGLAQPE